MFVKAMLAEVKRGDRVYQLSCDPSSPLGELHDVLMELKGHCVERMIAAQKEENERMEKQKQVEESQPAEA